MKKIIIQKQHDRVIYIFENGINYNMGIDDIDLEMKPCPELTSIYSKLLIRHKKKYSFKLVKKAIEIYNMTNIYFY